MNLLEKYASAFNATTTTSTRTSVMATVLASVPAKPALVDGDIKPKLCVSVHIDGVGHKDFYVFADATRGIPAMIPTEGIPAQVVLQESAPDKDGVQYLNAVYIGVGA